MILISSSELERQIAENALTSWEKTKYIILITAMYCLNGPIYILAPSFGSKPPLGNSLVSLLSSITFVFITYWGIKKCYHTNKTCDDAHFIERFTLLSVPMTIIFTLFFVPAFLLLAFFSSLFVGEDRQINKDMILYSFRVLSTVGMLVYYILLNRSFQRFVILMKKMGSLDNSIEADG
jgi:hypothetical protein